MSLYGGIAGANADFSGKSPQAPITTYTAELKIVQTLNKGEYGDVIYVNINKDVSSGTSFSIKMQSRFGDLKERTESDGVALGTTNVTVDGEKYMANEYLTYTVKEGDLDVAGIWQLKGIAVISSTRKIIGDYQYISVLS